MTVWSYCRSKLPYTGWSQHRWQRMLGCSSVLPRPHSLSPVVPDRAPPSIERRGQLRTLLCEVSVVQDTKKAPHPHPSLFSVRRGGVGGKGVGLAVELGWRRFVRSHG